MIKLNLQSVRAAVWVNSTTGLCPDIMVRIALRGAAVTAAWYLIQQK